MITRMALSLLLGSFLKTSIALACTCSSWQNGQQAAQEPGAIVAQVETLESNGDGSAKLKIHDVLKGEIDETEIQVLGQDGLNCNGELIHEPGQQWILLFNQVENRYESLSCADVAFPVNSENKKIRFQFQENETLELTETEFRKILNLKALPTLRGMSCSVEVNRLVVDQNTETHRMDFQFMEFYSSPRFSPLIARIDFSSQAPQMNIFKLNAQLKQNSPSLFDFRMTVLEPFFGVTDASQEKVDISKSSYPESLFLSQFTDLNGKPLKDHPEGEPFMSHRTFVECFLDLGAPLVILD